MALTHMQVEEVHKLRQQGLSYKKIAQELHVSVPTVQKYLRLIQEQQLTIAERPSTADALIDWLEKLVMDFCVIRDAVLMHEVPVYCPQCTDENNLGDERRNSA